MSAYLVQVRIVVFQTLPLIFAFESSSFYLPEFNASSLLLAGQALLNATKKATLASAEKSRYQKEIRVE